MFDLIAGTAAHIPNRPAAPLVASALTHLAAATVIVLASVAVVTEQLPQVPAMMAFVAEVPPPPPPPPPAPAPSPSAAEPPQRPEPVRVPTPVPEPSPTPEPVPADVEPEPAVEEIAEVPGGAGGGMPGGVAGGVAGGAIGGTIGGVIGGVVSPAPAIVTAPPLPAPPEPIRVGGIVDTPTLLHRVEPDYPPAAVAANLQGLVIIEAVVDETGCVSDATVLRSAGSVLDRSALAAVRQWRYTPLLHNGRQTPFILTVTLSFTLQPARR